MTNKTYPKQLTYTHKVKTHDVDYQQEMKITELMNLLQELATQHADLLDFGYDHLLRKNQFWALSRLRLELNHLPQWKQTLDCVTWTNGLEGIFPLRNWQIFIEGRLALAGYAQWLILDGKSHRPIRPDKSDFEGKTHPQIATQSPVNKLKPLLNAIKLAEYEVRLHELDMNGHVNNVYYFAWISDSLGMEFNSNNRVKTIDINYMKEITYPAKIEVYSNAEHTRFMLFSSHNNTIHSLVDVAWNTRKLD